MILRVRIAKLQALPVVAEMFGRNAIGKPCTTFTSLSKFPISLVLILCSSIYEKGVSCGYFGNDWSLKR